METPKISVLMPAYNHKDYVEEAIESVLQQTYKNFEFLVADDASIDGTAEKILKYESEISEIHLFHENAGARGEYLCKRAHGDFVAIMNSDDVWEKDKLEKQIKCLEDNPTAVACFTWCDRIDENGNLIKDYNPFKVKNRKREEWVNYFFFYGNCFANSSVLIKKDVYVKLRQNAAEKFRQIPDFYMWNLLLQQYDVVMLEDSVTKIRTDLSAKKYNVSACSKENIIRQSYEECYMWYELVDDMEPNFFLNVFRKQLIDIEACDEQGIMCEKFMILLQCKLEFCRMAAIFYFYKHYKDMRERLKERYNFTNKDMHKLVLSIGPYKI